MANSLEKISNMYEVDTTVFIRNKKMMDTISVYCKGFLNRYGNLYTETFMNTVKIP